jgi:multisubunit Na+/H+ antiporter MnhG subunit
VETAGKALLGGSIVLLVLGAVFLLLARIGVGRLPGDVVLRRGNFTLYAPLGLMVVLSVVLTIALNLLRR